MAPKKKKKKRTWGQRFKILVLVLLIGAALFRIALNVLLPTVINRVAGMYGLECGYDRLGLSLLGGHANLYGLKLRPQGGGESLMQADYIEGDLSVLELFRGNLIVYRAEVDGVVVAIDREADGTLPILQRFMAAKATTPQSAPVAATQPASPYNLNPPLRVDAIRLSHVRARIRDKSVSPTFEAVVQTTLRVSDVGRSDGPTKFELDVGVEPLLDTLRASGTATTTADSLKADVSVLVRGLHPKRAAGYLRPLGLVPVADDMTVKADMSIDARTIPNSADVTAKVTASNISAVADGAEWASLGSLTLDAKRLSAAAAELDKLTLTHGMATAHRRADGGIEVAGLLLAPVQAAAATQPATQPAAPAAVAVTSGPPFRLSLGELDARDLTATVTDAGVSPVATLVARLDTLSVRSVDTASDKPIPIAAEAAFPGVLRHLVVTGQVAPLAATRTASFKLAGDGLRPDAIQPYLDRLGVTSMLNDARFTADFDAGVSQVPDGTITADAAAANVKLSDGPATLVELNAAKITGLSLSPETGAIAVKDINLSGPALTVTREADDRVSAIGFKLTGAPTTRPTPLATGVNPRESAAATVAAPHDARVDTRGHAPSSSIQPSLPRIELGHLKWSDLKLTLDDKATAGAQPFVLNQVGVELSNLLLDLSAPDAGGRPGAFTAYVAAPGLADLFTAYGTFTPKPNQLITNVTVTGDGLSGEKIAAYLRPFGIEPTLRQGRLNARATATVTQTPDGRITGDFEASDITYADGDVELAGVDYFKLGDLRVTPTRVDINELIARKPRARVARLADGTFQAGGVHLLPATRPADAQAAIVPAGGTNGRESTTRPAAAPGPVLAALPIELGLKTLRVEDAAIDMSDAATPNGTPAVLRVKADLSMDELNVASDTREARLSGKVSLNDTLRSARFAGTIRPSPTRPGVKLQVSAEGVRAGQLAAYLPPAIEPLWADGRFSGSLVAELANETAGGVSGYFVLTTPRWTDAGKADHAAGADRVAVFARRIDPAAGVFALDGVQVTGVEATVRQMPAGLEAAGVRLRNAPAPSAATRPAAPTTAPAGLPAIRSVAEMVTDARRPLPLLVLDDLQLGVSRLTLGGFTGEKAADVIVRDLLVTSPRRISLGGAEAESAPPLQLKITGGVDPLVGRFEVGLTATPFATEPAVAVAVNARGLRGDGLTKVLPSLAQQIGGEELKDGAFATTVKASINYGRRGPRDFDVGRGFTAAFEVKPAELRQTADGPVIAGLKGIRADSVKVSPATGDVSVKALEIDTPIARIVRDDKGIHAAGLVAKIGANESVENLTPATQATTQPSASPAAQDTTRRLADSPPAERPKNEIRLDRLTVSGVDVVIEDRTATPHTVVPLKSLDVDVQNLSNQLPWNAKSVRFGVLVTSGKVPLPPRKGAKGEATTRPAGGEYTEQRELFSQITASGKIGFVRRGDTAALDGWAKTAVNGFELLGVRGLAKQYNVTVGGGAFDDTNDIRFNPNGNIETKNRIVFTNLSLSEPENGPLRRLLKLPTPIDVAIGAVTDPDGSITLNVPVPVKNGAVKVSDVVGPALGAVSNVLLTAIASAPVKAVQGIGSLVGLGPKDAAPEPPVVLPFLPAYPGLGREARESLDVLRKQLEDDPLLELQVRHTLSDADVARTATRVNPPPAQCLVLAEQVRKQKADLEAQYAALAAEARGDFGAQADTRAKQATDSLRDVGRRLAAADQSLDELYALASSNATGLADRRTRTAALAIAQKRLDNVRDDLAGGNESIAKRISLTNPQFDPATMGTGGEVTVVLVRKKK